MPFTSKGTSWREEENSWYPHECQQWGSIIDSKQTINIINKDMYHHVIKLQTEIIVLKSNMEHKIVQKCIIIWNKI